MSDWRVRGEPCPRCHTENVVYNGNYYCEHCDWAMGEQGRPARIIVAFLTQQMSEAIATGDTERADRMKHYLSDYVPVRQVRLCKNPDAVCRQGGCGYCSEDGVWHDIDSLPDDADTNYGYARNWPNREKRVIHRRRTHR
jgi:hypothetical protein